MFSGLSVLVVEDIRDAGDAIVVRARTRAVAVACPGCGAETGRVHGYHERTAADVPADGRRVVLKVRGRRMRCPVTGCTVQTFREQVPGVLDRYQRRTARLSMQVSAVARELAGRASARLLPALGTAASRHTMLRSVLKIPLPALAVPRVWGPATSRCAVAASTRPCSSTLRPAIASTPSRAAPPASRRNG
jgi:transposase